MPKTRELTIICDEARINHNYSHGIKAVLDDPDINGLLEEIDWDDVVAFVQSESRNKPELVFDEEYLEKWAEENGYVKQ